MQAEAANNFRVALYARVSTEEQREGQTIDSQMTEETLAKLYRAGVPFSALRIPFRDIPFHTHLDAYGRRRPTKKGQPTP